MDFSGLQAEGTLEGFDVDPSLMEEARELDGELIPHEEVSGGGTSEPEDDTAGEFVVDAMEMLMQAFGHESFEMPAGKKAMLAGSYAKLAKKYEGKTPAFLGDFKEELMVIVLTVIVMAGSYKTIKALKEDDAKQAEKKGGDNGKKPE